LVALSLSLAACLGWGVADFLGGLKSRQLSVFSVLMVSSFFGLGAILVIVIARGVAPPDDPALLLAGVGLAVGSAIAAGIFFVVMDQASEADPYWAAFLMRFSYFVFLIIIFLLKRPAVQAGKVHMPAIIVLGICDALAGFAYALATTRGMLGLVAVVGALYPTVTVLLSMLVLHERPQRAQFIGVLLAVGGVAFISAGSL
jgi:drug/metabolite transporter (DMT)-like permease